MGGRKRERKRKEVGRINIYITKELLLLTTSCTHPLTTLGHQKMPRVSIIDAKVAEVSPSYCVNSRHSITAFSLTHPLISIKGKWAFKHTQGV